MTTQPGNTQETKIVMADGTAVGVFGLAIVTFVAATEKLGWTAGSNSIIPWALFLGSAAQLWAAAVDYKKNNYFGAIVLGAFGLFWVAVSTHWMISNGWFGNLTGDVRQFGFACIGYTIFSAFITVAAFEVNKVFGVMLTLITVLLGSLGLYSLGVSPEIFKPLAGWSELIVSILGFYASGAIFLNTYFGRVLLPVGAPMGFIRKGA